MRWRDAVADLIGGLLGACGGAVAGAFQSLLERPQASFDFADIGQAGAGESELAADDAILIHGLLPVCSASREPGTVKRQKVPGEGALFGAPLLPPASPLMASAPPRNRSAMLLSVSFAFSPRTCGWKRRTPENATRVGSTALKGTGL